MRKIYLLSLTCIIWVLGMAASAQPVDLLVHYLFDETSGTVAADHSGNGFDGTVSGTASWVEGTLGGALEFKGTDSVVVPAATMGMTSNNGSVAFWMYAGVPTTIYTMFWAGDNRTGGGFGAENEIHFHLETAGDYWRGGELSFFLIGNPNLHIFSDPEKGTTAAAAPVNPKLLGDSAWHHVAATWGGGSAKLYIDGALIMEGAYTATGYQLSHIYLGQMANQGRTYIGKLDDVRIYSGPLAAFAVEDLYNKVTTVNDIKNKNHLSFYPNPARDYLNVNFVSEAGKLAEVSMVNLAGQEVTAKSFTTIIGANDVAVDLDGVSQGMYFIRLKLDNETTVEKVLVK